MTVTWNTTSLGNAHYHDIDIQTLNEILHLLAHIISSHTKASVLFRVINIRNACEVEAGRYKWLHVNHEEKYFAISI